MFFRGATQFMLRATDTLVTFCLSFKKYFVVLNTGIFLQKILQNILLF